MAKLIVQFAGKEYTGEALTDTEKTLLFHHLFNYIAAGNDFLGALLKQNQEGILGAAAVAKEKFQATFAGLLAADPQMGVSIIRPGHILRTTGATETPVNTWDTEAVVAGAFVSGEDNWIGYDANNATASHADKEALIMPMGIGWTQGHEIKVAEVRFQVGETVYPVQVVRQSMYADNQNRIRAVRIHPLLVEPKNTILGQVFSETGGRQEMQLLGLTFGMGRFLRARTYASVAV